MSLINESGKQVFNGLVGNVKFLKLISKTDTNRQLTFENINTPNRDQYVYSVGVYGRNSKIDSNHKRIWSIIKIDTVYTISGNWPDMNGITMISKIKKM